MNYLMIDEQTMSDLSIFGKSGKQSVYDLYHATTTHGGGARLEQLFRQPLTDHEAINERVAIYRFFTTQEHTFPIDSETIGTLAYYLENEDVRTQLQVGSQSLANRFQNMVAADADYVFVNDGVQACLRLVYKLNEFIKELNKAVKGSAYEIPFNEIERLANASELKVIRNYCSPKREVKLSVSVVSELDKLIRFEQRETVLELLDRLYDLDVCIAVGQVARKRNFHFAKAFPKDSGALLYRQVYHPHVKDAVANDLELNKENNILFLTGANMAGKSTLMKSIGVALYVAHMGFPVAAQQFEFAVRDGIFTSINLADNLSAGASHYYAEVLRVKEVALELKKGSQLFVIFDELFRGTNVKDAYDATIAITTAFGNKRTSQFIVSTHIMEAGEILQKKQLPIKYKYLPTDMQGVTPVYTRILRDGITADRHGMIIIKNEGILDILDAGMQKQTLKKTSEVEV